FSTPGKPGLVLHRRGRDRAPGASEAIDLGGGSVADLAASGGPGRQQLAVLVALPASSTGVVTHRVVVIAHGARGDLVHAVLLDGLKAPHPCLAWGDLRGGNAPDLVVTSPHDPTGKTLVVLRADAEGRFQRALDLPLGFAP